MENLQLHNILISHPVLLKESAFQDGLRGQHFYRESKCFFKDVLLMQKRRKAMSNVLGYSSCLKRLLGGVNEETDDLLCCEFIFSSSDFFIFYRIVDKELIGFYENPNLTIGKVLSLNEEYSAKGIRGIDYVEFNPIK